jgi:hypothetical protein
MDQAITHNRECHGDSNHIHLAKENLTRWHTHCPQDIRYSYLSLCPFEVEIAPLHPGQNFGSTVIARPGCHPGLFHSPLNNHHRVAVMVRPSSYIRY